MKLRRYAYLFLGMSLGLAGAMHVYATGNYAFAKSGSIGSEDANIVDTETAEVGTEEELKEALENYKSVKLKNDIELTKQLLLQDPKSAESILKITIDGDGHRIYTTGFKENNGSLVYV